MIKVLHVFAGMNKGGVESFVLNLHKALKDSDIRFDFLVRSSNGNRTMVQYFKNSGSRIYVTKSWPLHVFQNYIQMKRFFIKHAGIYDFIHIHMNSLMYMLPVTMADRYMPDTRIIIHSHNTKVRYFSAMPLHYINRRILKRYRTISLACSHEAGKWMFTGRYTVVPNGIDVSRFQAEPGFRTDSDTLQLVSVGKIENQKNYFFMLSVIKALKAEGVKVRYRIAGEGSLKKEFIKVVRTYGLSAEVKLLGNIESVERLLRESHIFMMPSKYEGLGIALLEAQCSGIPCVISDRIPRESAVCPNVYRIPLQKDQWVRTVKNIAAMEDTGYCKTNSKRMAESRYSLKGLALSMQDIYQTERNVKW